MKVYEDDRCRIQGKPPQGFRLIQAFVSKNEQETIEQWILRNFPWEKRRNGPLPPAEQYPYDGSIPEWAIALGTRMVALGIFPTPPDHVLLRRYRCGVGVVPHVDREEYGPIVAGLTIASSRMMTLTPVRGKSRLDAMLLPGDLYVMTGEARHRWRHGIPARVEDEFRGQRYPRADGFSVTWRYLPRTAIPKGRWAQFIDRLRRGLRPLNSTRDM